MYSVYVQIVRCQSQYQFVVLKAMSGLFTDCDVFALNLTLKNCLIKHAYIFTSV